MSASLAGLKALRAFVAGPVERCGFCRVRISDEPAHLIEAASSRMVRACAACALEETSAELEFWRVAPRPAATSSSMRIIEFEPLNPETTP
jgi:hypothetical protein